MGVYQFKEGTANRYNAGFYSFNTPYVNLTYIEGEVVGQATNWNINGQSGSFQHNTGGSQGMVIINFENDAKKIYRNKIFFGSGLSTNLTSQKITQNGYLLCWNSNGTASSFNNSQLSFYYVGKRITSNEVKIISDAFESYMSKRNKGVIWEPEIVNYISGLTTPLSVEQVGNLNTFVADIKSGLTITGLTEAFDVMYILAAETPESGLRNLVTRSYDATAVNNPVFRKFSGFKGDSITAYINTNYNPSTNGVKYELNNASMGIYLRDKGTIDQRSQLGARVAYLSDMAYIDWGGTNWVRTPINEDNTPILNTIPNPRTNGMLTSCRNNDITTKTYYDKTLIATNELVSDVIPNLNHFMLAINQNGGATRYDNCVASFVFEGKSFNDSEIGVIFDAFEKYMDSNGMGII